MATSSKEQIDDQIQQLSDSLTEVMAKSKQNEEQMENIQAEYMKEMQKLVTLIEDEKRKRLRHEDRTEAEHQSEIQRLETRIQENDSQMADLQSEIQSLKLENNDRIEELRAMEYQHDRHLEILEERMTELHYRPKDDGGADLPDIFVWKIEGITKMMDLVQFKYHSKDYFTNQNGEKFQPVILKTETSKCVEIILDFTATHSSQPYLHSRRYFLIDQSTSMTKNNVELIDRPECKKNSHKDMMAEFLTYAELFYSCILQGENKYVKNDAILIKIILEPIAFLWKQIEAQDGVFVWRINNYSKKKKDEIDGVKWCLTSKPFKTSHSGFTAYLELYLNGIAEGEGKFNSIYLRFLLGEHDESLPFPFKCSNTFCLIDQSDSAAKENLSGEFTHEFKDVPLHWGFPQFVLQSTVESSKYLKNDSIEIETNVIIL